jgi:plastocyanin
MSMRFELARSVLTVMLLLSARAALGNDLLASVKDDSGAPIADAVVVAVADAPAKLPAPRLESLVQESKEFKPFVKAVLVGTPVEFPNRDDVLHHVYSFSPARTFELKAYAGTPPDPIVFDRPGPVAIGCNIHDWMLAYVYASESPYFGVTGVDGRARLVNLPAGKYSVRVWHYRLTQHEAETAQAITMTGAEATQVAWQLKLKRDSRVRRAPTRPGGGYR